MRFIWQKLQGAFGRVFPGCVTLGQAVAFNMFLAFFPMLLFALGLLVSSDLFRLAVPQLPANLRMFLPPGGEKIILDYFARRGFHPQRWIAMGLGGTLLAGTQAVIGLMHGFRIIDGRELSESYLRLQFRAVLLVSLIMGPWLIVVLLTVFGKQVRARLIHALGLPGLIKAGMLVAYGGVVLALGVGVLMVLYRMGQPGERGWKEVFPGAAIATLFWWFLDGTFGLYVRHVPYGMVYGGLAAAIGLMLWMYMTAMTIFLGAAYNTESAVRSGKSRLRSR